MALDGNFHVADWGFFTTLDNQRLRDVDVVAAGGPMEWCFLPAIAVGATTGVGYAREQQTHDSGAVREIARPIRHDVQERPVSACVAFDLESREIRVIVQQALQRGQISSLDGRGRGMRKRVVGANRLAHLRACCQPIAGHLLQEGLDVTNPSD